MRELSGNKLYFAFKKAACYAVVLTSLILAEFQAWGAGTPELEVESIASASNGYGGVKVNIKLPSGYNDNYVYVLERSDNCLTWEKVGLTFDYAQEKQDICAKTIRVLNIYPDNQSFDLPQNFKDNLSLEQQQTQKRLYHIPDVVYTFADGTKKTLPKSAALKVWLEGGSYQDEKEIKTFQSVAQYKDQQMIKVDLMGMSQFNATIKRLSDLQNYDALFFGTWDANAWNDLSEQSRKAVEAFLDASRGVIFGHDTIACQIADQGVYTGEVELENFFKLKDYMNFDMIPYSYKNASLEQANAQRRTLPLHYQIWGGSAQNQAIVQFFRAENKINSSLTTFPNHLLQGQGKLRNLKVPNTHTSWLGLNKAQQNIVCFKNNEYQTLPNAISQAYENQPNMQYNWYLAGGRSIYSCYMIQTGHSRCNSEIDERKLIANVLAQIKKTENLHQLYQSKVDVSAQDYARPIVDQPILSKNGGALNINFQGKDEGTVYYFRVRILDLNNGMVNMSEKKNVKVTTGIRNYYYIIDERNSNYDFDIEQSEKVTLNQNGASVVRAIPNITKKYIHIKAIDFAGNISEPVCYSLQPQFQPQLQPLELETVWQYSNNLHQAQTLDGIRNYYVKENAQFQLKSATKIQPFAYKLTQPYWNQINSFKVRTLLDEHETGEVMESAAFGEIDRFIQVLNYRQNRTDSFSKLSLTVNASFRPGSDGKTILLRPSGAIMDCGVEKKTDAKKEHCVYITCDGKGPEIKNNDMPYWHHAQNYRDAASLTIQCKDSGSGFSSSTVNLKKRINGQDVALAYQNGNSESRTYQFREALEEGIFSYEILARDHVSNETRKTVEFGVDKTPPALHGLNFCYGWSKENITVRVTATDNLSGVKRIRLLDENGALIYQSDGNALEYQFKQEQDKAYMIDAQDFAGNKCLPSKFQIKIDKTAPQINGRELIEENIEFHESKHVYYIPSDLIQATASDLFDGATCSGMKLMTLKDQNGRVIEEKRHVNAGGSAVNESDFIIEHQVLSAQESDYYSIVAQDWAGNLKRIYIVPQICRQNRIRRKILHDNYEDKHGYYRIYE